ncbi:MAG: gfo/Idh/MocA family oxidoreductase [Chitinivibrionales bacterium]|nr:gfo/Idh/MocA family oxidoreductase [Chitinivibrionales bacterium]
MITVPQSYAPSSHTVRKPRLGFVGIGWIGLHRLKAVAAAELVEIAALVDTRPENVFQARQWAPGASLHEQSSALLTEDIDGVVIATPNALHAAQSIEALEAGKAVFCQKPLGRNHKETRAVIDAARAADRLLGVDFSYRHLAGMHPLRALLDSGELGDVYAAQAVFHNAYGPDKPWFYDPAQAGGGCVLDLGIHLLDMILWPLHFPAISSVKSRLFARGAPVRRRGTSVEDYATVQMDLDGGIAATLACSWNLSLGCDAQIELTFFGSKGGASIRNVNGSFFDFVTERFTGTRREVLHAPPDEWGGRALVQWADRLAHAPHFDPTVTQVAAVAHAVDRIYESC